MSFWECSWHGEKKTIKDITDLKLSPRVQSVVTGNGKISLKGTVKKELVQHDSEFHTQSLCFVTKAK